MNLRFTALRVLARWEAGDAYINLAIGRAAEGLPDADRRYLTALVYGTVEKKLTLDYAIGALAHRSDVSPAAKSILECGLYELFYLHTPRHAAVNAWVDLAGSRGEKSFINGVLRAASALDTLPLPPRDKNEMRYLSVCYSVPLATVKRLTAVFGEETEDFLRATATPPHLTLHINSLRISRADYLARLAAAGMEAVPTPYAPAGVRLTGSCPPRDLPGFAEGWFFVQDEASQIATEALGAEPGEAVIDLCACPGGKSFGAAIRMADRGQVLSFDLHASKLSLIESGAARLGLTCITVKEHDATLPDPALAELADRVICDVPCSGLGVLSKKPDLRYKDLRAADELPALQSAILRNAASCVRPGGILLYSTCTVNPAENESVTDAFRAAHPAFIPEDFTVGGLSSTGGRLTLLPHRHGTDGFYLAKFRRSDGNGGTQKK